jgi:hypothetical protein
MLSKERGDTGDRVYQEDKLQGVVKHLNMTFFVGQKWVFQHDSVPAQKAKTTQEWLWSKLLALHQCRGLALGESMPQNPGQ